MEALSLLEKKITDLITAIKTLKKENAELVAQNKSLAKQFRDLEGSMVRTTDNVKELSQEKEVADLMVSDLIKSIDSLVKSDQR